MGEVILYGMLASPYSRRVELALKLKAIPFEYVEEDLRNKNPNLLHFNPVYNIPLLVHNQKPIAQSLVILEYIDETWKNNGPRLLPKDPYKRAKVRFWANYIHQQLMDIMLTMVKTDGERQEKAVKEMLEKLPVLEEGMKELFPDGNPCINDDNMGLLDIVLYSLFGSNKVKAEEVIGINDIKIVDPKRTPLIFSWLEAVNEVPLVIQSNPPVDEMVALLKFVRETALKSSSAN
ncbi:hypothetical protein COLO4_19597 [Corchorus olitorius]|uniref:Glutathione S-transferase n=1 Tax=Corchorus olitorius TaxID=93759 RepID=A0A1R3J4L0_9ROSI|nr:hypothetical protein COLO4_19597 [Corchorus olitorius]